MEQQNSIELSPETFARMKAELEELTTNGRTEMATRLQRARELGDLKENSEYHSAKEAQGLMEARIRQLEHNVKNAIVRDRPADADSVVPGVIVKIKEGDDVDEYLVASTNEEKLPGLRTLTTGSPLGKAIIGRTIGDKVEIEAPGGHFTVEVLAIRSA